MTSRRYSAVVTAVDGAGHLVQRLRECIACGYSLEGLPGDGACPECGRVFAKDEFCIAGISPIMLLTPMGCAGTIAALSASYFIVLAMFGRFLEALAFALVGGAVVGGLLAGARLMRSSTAMSGPHLLLLTDELRIRHGSSDALAFRWADITNAALRHEMPGLWRLTITLSSIALRPKFYFRADRGRAEALRALIERRAAEGRKR